MLHGDDMIRILCEQGFSLEEANEFIDIAYSARRMPELVAEILSIHKYVKMLPVKTETGLAYRDKIKKSLVRMLAAYFVEDESIAPKN